MEKIKSNSHKDFRPGGAVNKQNENFDNEDVQRKLWVHRQK